MDQYVVENSISLKLNDDHKYPTKCKVFYNPVMQICRELVLSSLSALVQKCDYPVKCLDAFGATGVAGLQWKHYLAEKVKVSINEIDDTAYQSIKENCVLNKKEYVESAMSGSSEDCDTCSDTNTGERIKIIQSDAHVILHQRQFHFIHLDPYGTTVQYLDAAFRNIYHKGMMVITATDVATLFGKFPHVALRNYGAHVTKVSFHKEMAVRLLIAAAVRSAAKANKGIVVLHSVCVEHFVQVCVLIQRGAAHADKCVTKIRKVLCCQLCENWAICPSSALLHDSPYSLLGCKCHDGTPGKTAVELGPLWCGNIFQIEHINQIAAEASKLKLSSKIRTLLSTMQSECECSHKVTITESQAKTDTCTSSPESSNVIDSTSVNECNKRPSTEITDSSDSKRQKTDDTDGLEYDVPFFYLNIHKNMKLSGINLPKASKLVQQLQEAGYRASRTHFEPKAIRTNATIEQVKMVITGSSTS